MARFALLRGTNVYNVIVAATVADADAVAARMGLTAREVVTESEVPIAASPVVSRTCEPGATLIEREALVSERPRARFDGTRWWVEDFSRP